MDVPKYDELEKIFYNKIGTVEDYQRTAEKEKEKNQQGDNKSHSDLTKGSQGPGPKDKKKENKKNPFHLTFGFTGSSSAYNFGLHFKLFGFGVEGSVQKHESMVFGINDNNFVIMQKKYKTGSQFTIAGFGEGVSATTDKSNYLNSTSYTRETYVPFFSYDTEINSITQKPERTVESLQVWDVKLG